MLKGISGAVATRTEPSSQEQAISIIPYRLDRCQIDTPDEIVRGFWALVMRHRKKLGRVIDLGAGDGRFAFGAAFDSYDGYEIDRQRIQRHNLPKNATVIYKNAFDADGKDYDVCVGNPPYVRHHDIDEVWREQLVGRIKKDLGIASNKLCNLFVYFFFLAISKTKSDGLVALLVPYEWVSRPSSKPLRDFIRSKGWDVHVYHFRDEVFKGVLTTASISIIDKAGTSGRWKFYNINPRFSVAPKKQLSGSRHSVLRYQRRTSIWSLRGLSPGSQKIFTLTEGERIHLGLKKSDVVRCITSLRHVPKSLERLTAAAFRKHYIDAGRKCWLIRSNRKLSSRLKKYLDSIPAKERDTSTCTKRDLWYAYKSHPAPALVYGSGFTKLGPKILVNSAGAVAVGSVHGVHSEKPFSTLKLRQHLVQINFERRVVAHAGSLKKIEVGQMNSLLTQFVQGEEPAR